MPECAKLSDDGVLDGRLLLLQPRRGHRFGHDAVLLAAAVAARAGERAVDLGAGVGAAGLALAARCAGLSVTLVEIDRELAALAARNIERNALGERVRVLCLDVTAPARTAAGLAPASFDHVLMNPPFNDPARYAASPQRDRRRAHAANNLADWVKTAARLLREGGALTLIYRAEAVAQVFAALPRSFGGVMVRPIHPKPALPAIRVIVTAKKASRAPLTLLPPLVLNDANGQPTAAATAILRDAAALGTATG